MCDKSGVNLQRFKKLIDDSGKSRQELAEIFGCDTSTITKHYNGDRGITTDYLIKYAEYFGVSADYLLGLSDVPTTNAEIQAICKYTGLSYAAVERLHTQACPMTLADFTDSLGKADVEGVIANNPSAKQMVDRVDGLFNSGGEDEPTDYKQILLQIMQPTIRGSIDSSKDFVFLLNRFLEDPEYRFMEIISQIADYIKSSHKNNSDKEFCEFKLFSISKTIGSFADTIANEYIDYKNNDDEAKAYQREQDILLKTIRLFQSKDDLLSFIDKEGE